MSSPKSNRGIPNCSRKKTQNRGAKIEKISKYFSRSSSTDNAENKADGAFTYLTNLSEIKKIESKDESDFKSPMVLKPATKLKVPKKVIKRKCTKKDNLKQKTLTDKFSVKGADDNLQLAIALSKSLKQEEYDEDTSESEIIPVYPSTQEITENARKTLEQYGFHCFRKSGSSTGIERRSNEVVKKQRKKRLFRLVPILQKRTEEDRQNIISTKIRLILNESTARDVNISNEESADIVLTNPVLKELQSIERKIFKINNLLLEELNESRVFYVKFYNLPESEYKCGSLLKRWEDIPGRELTPLRDIQKVVDQESNELTSRRNIQIDTNQKEELISEELNLDSAQHTQTENILTQFNRSSNQNFTDCTSALNINFNTKNMETENFNDKQNLSSRFSPDLFESDEEITSQESKFTITPEKPSSSLKENYLKEISSENEGMNDSYDKSSETNLNEKSKINRDVSDDDIMLNSNGIYHFESFCEKEIVMNNSTDNILIDLTELSDSETKKSENQLSLEKKGSTSSLNKSFFDYSNKSNLNITDYVANLLDNCRESGNFTEEINESNQKNLSFKRQESNESIGSSTSVTTISDEELNYSCIHSETPRKSFSKAVKSKFELSDSESGEQENNYTPEKKNKNMNIYGILKEIYLEKKDKLSKEIINISDDEEVSLNAKNYFDEQLEFVNQNLIEIEDIYPDASELDSNVKISTPILHPRVVELSKSHGKNIRNNVDNLNAGTDSPKQLNTPKKTHMDSDSNLTPLGTMIMKKSNVTPRPDFEIMQTPEINNELDKYGIKKLKRSRGVELLKYIYESTHPMLDADKSNGTISDDTIQPKRKKLCFESEDKEGLDKNEMLNPSCRNEGIEVVGDALNVIPVDEMIFERKISKKIFSCQIPLHIAWHNFISMHPDIKENILLYEPLQLEVLHEMLKSEGLNYHLQDLITFLDKNCITIRIAQGGSRTKKRS